MTNAAPQPCARWADLLAAHPDNLSAQERRALDAHVATCQACAAARADYRRMDARIRSLPDPRTRPEFPPWLLALQAGARRDARVKLNSHSLEYHMQTKKELSTDVPTPTSGTQRRQTRRVVSWVSAVAALVVVTLVTAALLASHGGGRAGTAGSPTNTVSPTSASGKWTFVPGLTNQPGQPYFAPSNPAVIYLVGTGPTSLKRSNDGGARWENLPLPPLASQAENADLQVSAANAQNIFFNLSFALSSRTCAAATASRGAVNAYSGGSCSVSYFSTDGGEHWALMYCLACTKALFITPGIAPVGTIVAQGQRLYSAYYDMNGNERLIASTDGGQHWALADAALRAQGQGMCSFAAAAKGASIFAMAQAGQCTQAVGYAPQPVGPSLHAATHPQAASEVAIWRSDDEGAHWTQVGAFPYQQPDTASFTAYNAGGAQTTLFAAAGEYNSYIRYASVDGGKTWQPLPSAGLPNASALMTTGAMLSDGSILAFDEGASSDGSTAVYAWKPGSQAWQQITTGFAGVPSSLLVSGAAGHETLWLVTFVSVSTYNALFYTLP